MDWGFARGIRREFRSPLYRNAVFLMANTVVGKALGFVFWIIAARFYPSTDVGLTAIDGLRA